MDIQQEEEVEAADGITNKTLRKVVTTGYDLYFYFNILFLQCVFIIYTILIYFSSLDIT